MSWKVRVLGMSSFDPVGSLKSHIIISFLTVSYVIPFNSLAKALVQHVKGKSWEITSFFFQEHHL